MVMCTSDDMLYASENGLIQERNLRLRAPKPSYEIINKITKNDNNILNIEIKPTKEVFFDQKIIPNWIDLNFYSIPKKNGKRITLVNILNKCFTSDHPKILEPNVIFYCHENETDLLRIINFLIDISIQMKCDIISFEYQGFGFNYNNSNTKPKMETLFNDGEEALKLAITYLNYKIENVSLMGKGIGGMCGLYLSSNNSFAKCKSLILCNPILNINKFDIKIMRNINCKCLLIMEIKSKEDIEINEAVYLCREIPNEQEWFPIKKDKNNNKFSGFKKYFNNTKELFNDVYFRHRSKFIIKLKDYIYPEEESVKNRKKGSSSIGESTESETNWSTNKILNLEDVNEIKNEIKEEKNKINIKKEENIFNEPEIQINNNDDY